jgi:hypothetical protein
VTLAAQARKFPTSRVHDAGAPMAKKPDYERDLGNLEGKVDMLVQSTAGVGDLAGKVTILTTTLYALIALLVPFGGALMWQVLDGKWKLDEKISGLGERLARIEVLRGSISTALAGFCWRSSPSPQKGEQKMGSYAECA